MSTQTNNSATLAKLGRRIAALQKYGSAMGTILINGQAFTPVQIAALYQKSADDRTQADSLRGMLHGLVVQQKLDDAAYQAVEKALEAFVIAKYGAGTQPTVDFGYLPPKARKTAVKVKALAAEKSLATRAARHTMGSRQKEEIKGTLPAQATSVPATLALNPTSGK